ncbi:MAG: hypothetical protein ACLQHM_11025 [Limisphaerales bacterium]
MFLNDEYGFAAGDFGRVMDFIISVVRKEREIRVAASSGHRACAGDKHPMVGTTDDTHEEGPHPVIIGNLIKAFAPQVNLASLDGNGVELERIFADVQSPFHASCDSIGLPG